MSKYLNISYLCTFNALNILQSVYNNSLEDDDTKVYMPIPNINVQLRRHQYAVVDQMKEYEKNFKEGFSMVEYFGFNEDSGSVFCCLDGNITIFSRFGQNVFYAPSDDENKEFSTLDELVQYLKK